MSGANNAPITEGHEDPASLKGSFMGIPLTRWAIIAISAIIVGYTAVHFGVQAYTEALQVHQGDSEYAQAIAREMEAHKSDNGGHQTVIHDESGRQTLATYFSDGCISIQRPGEPLPYLTQPEAHVEWSLAPSRRPSLKPPAKLSVAPIWSLILASLKKFRVLSRDQADATNNPIQVAGVLSFPSDDTPLYPVQVGCLNPHPWGFQGSWGQANGCWVPFFRHWNDGCTHYQMYNTCSGQWDPAIHWTFCAGQHHP